jgi:hypothetical protein
MKHAQTEGQHGTDREGRSGYVGEEANLKKNDLCNFPGCRKHRADLNV